MVDDGVARDPEQPGGQRNAAMAVTGQSLEGLHEYLLGNVESILVAGHARPDVHVDPVAVSVVDRGKGGRLGLGSFDQLPVIVDLGYIVGDCEDATGHVSVLVRSGISTQRTFEWEKGDIRWPGRTSLPAQ